MHVIIKLAANGFDVDGPTAGGLSAWRSRLPTQQGSHMHGLSVVDHLGDQLARLARVLGIEPSTPVDLLAGLLGTHGSRPMSEPPPWPSDVADDHSPVEFSVAFQENTPPSLRILAEALGAPTGLRSNMSAAYAFLDAQAERFGLSMDRLNTVRDLFATEHPQGDFSLWCSLVFRADRRPEFKVYFNPELDGVQRAPELVAEALDRLGLGTSYRTMLRRAVRPGELGGLDRLAFFALDLHDGPQARVKVYLSHHETEAWHVAGAATMVDGVDATEVAEFCALAGRTDRFDGRPLVGSYTLTEGGHKPVGYSIYVPIRSYVRDDLQARDRVQALLARYGFDTGLLHRAIDAVTRRPLADGVGLIPHVSLRLGPPRPGVTVYLSAEAYQVCPPRSPWAPAVGAPRQPERPSSVLQPAGNVELTH